MGVPVVYRKSTDQSIASYNFIDTIENLGYIEFYCLSGSNMVGLSRNAVASQTPRIKFTIGDVAGTFVEKVNSNWDLSFNIPQVIGAGPLFGVGTVDSVTGNVAFTARLDLIISKVDVAGNASFIAQISGSPIVIGANKNGSFRMMTKVEIPQVKIKAGEKLRVNTRMYTHGGGAGGVAYLWCDGANRGTSTYNQIDPDANTADLGYLNSTNMIFTIPFKLDL